MVIVSWKNESLNIVEQNTWLKKSFIFNFMEQTAVLLIKDKQNFCFQSPVKMNLTVRMNAAVRSKTAGSSCSFTQHAHSVRTCSRKPSCCWEAPGCHWAYFSAWILGNQGWRAGNDPSLAFVAHKLYLVIPLLPWDAGMQGQNGPCQQPGCALLCMCHFCAGNSGYSGLTFDALCL